MPEVVTLDLAPGKGLDTGVGQRAPEATARIAIGEAPAEGERTAILVEPVANVLREERRALAESLRARRVSP